MSYMLLIVPLVALALAQDPARDAADLGTRVDRVVHRVDQKWVLVGATGTDEDRIHRWRRINDLMTVQARTFDTEQDAENHVKALVATLSVPVAEKLKIARFAARIGWGDGSSSVYLAVGRTAVVISAPSADLARRLSRQAAIEFTERRVEHARRE